MGRFKLWLLNYRVYSAIGLLLWSLIVWLVGPFLGMTGVGARLVVIAFFFVVWLAFILIKAYLARRASNRIGEMFSVMADSATLNATPDKRPELDQLKKRLLAAVDKIKASKLGHLSGKAALYELPWYMILGNPAAGKSSAIFNSGMNFPFADSDGKVIHGVGGTRNCDWFFTTEGILLDTAGRYSVYLEDRQEWLGFLSMLKKYRPRVPINGILVAASVPELTQSSPDFAVNLAKQIRQRIQELTEKLGVFLPVYVIFTKTDLISGFVEFFEDLDQKEREQVWGATLPYEQSENFDAQEVFESRFDELFEGLRAMALERMSQNRGKAQSPGLLTFPLEFLSVKPALRDFVATLFEENPYQFRPTFRGFYFTSALQEGLAMSASAGRIIQRFGLSGEPLKRESVDSIGGFFLRDLFSKVVFPDRNLVRQYASPRRGRLRMAGFVAGLALLGLTLGAWAWSFVGNQQLISSVRSDLAAATKVQEGKEGLGPRLRALTMIQDRLEQLDRYRKDHPLHLGFGLYQGEHIEAQLRKAYFQGVREVMLGPVKADLEAYLGRVASGAVEVVPATLPQTGGPRGKPGVVRTGLEVPAEPSSGPEVVSDDAYNALKTYLMLADRSRMEAGHLSDQLPRYWRSWLDQNRGNTSRETVIRDAEKIIGYYLSQINSPDLPVIQDQLTLVDQTREILRKVVRGVPARDRIYNEIKARASTRFPAITVAGILNDGGKAGLGGSYAIPGAFTLAAWDGFVQRAFKDAAEKQMDSSDWVLRTHFKDDLTMEGSPELLQKEFVGMYKAEYAQQWRKFVQGIALQDFDSLAQADDRLGRLGNRQNSPLYKLLAAIDKETSWDNGASVAAGVGVARQSAWGWFKERILRISSNGQSASRDQIYNAAVSSGQAAGTIGSEFTAINALVGGKGDGQDGSASLNGYFAALTKVRGRIDTILNAGDQGPGSLVFMKATFDGSGSELSDALKYVDENMLAGMSDSAKETIRPLLVRPLMQTFSALIKPADEELNREWVAAVREPFVRNIAMKYPFADARVEATPTEIGQYFGPDGAIAKYLQGGLGSVVIRRGDSIAPRTWGNMGVTLNPEFVANLSRYLAPVGGVASGGGDGSPGSESEIDFQLQPIPTPGFSEIDVEIDGQVLRYRNGPQDWTTFRWPNPATAPGSRVYGVKLDGETVEVANFPGRFGLNKLISGATKTKLGDGSFHLAWTNSGATIALNFRMISGATSNGNSPAPAPVANLRHISLPVQVVQ